MTSQCWDLHIMDLRAEKDRHAGERAGLFLLLIALLIVVRFK